MVGGEGRGGGSGIAGLIAFDSWEKKNVQIVEP